ncbi:hypothetical protein VUR80DRAFT_3762 [Thermomyces stellatus]
MTASLFLSRLTAQLPRFGNPGLIRGYECRRPRNRVNTMRRELREFHFTANLEHARRRKTWQRCTLLSIVRMLDRPPCRRLQNPDATDGLDSQMLDRVHRSLRCTRKSAKVASNAEEH